ncbi:MAG: hypothetical protein E7319_03985 [Clostridiales bacterium]|nr:hypothetical protein [Clostridiales bacterium]
MTQENNSLHSYIRDGLVDLKEVLARLDAIHRAITRAKGRIHYLMQGAQRANSRLTPVRYGRGVETSRIEHAVLESEAERWGIKELESERDSILQMVRPLVERLPAGLLRAVATQRILDGIPCGIIARRMHYSRSYIYRLLDEAGERMNQIHQNSK